MNCRVMLPTATFVLIAALSYPAAAAENLAEIEKPASTLEQILTHPADLGGEEHEVRVVTATIDPMTAAGWHTHPSPVYVYVEEGTLTMEVEGKEPQEITAGQAIAEPLDSPMRVLNKGQEPAKVVVFQISPPAQAFLEEGTGAQ